VFEKSPFQSSSWRTGARKSVAISLATAIELTLIAALMIVPLLRVAALPRTDWQPDVLPVPPQGPPAASDVSVRHEPTHKLTLAELVKTPVKIPKFIPRVVEKPLDLVTGPIALNPGGLVGIPGGIGSVGIMPGGAAIPPPPQAARPEKPVPLGGDVEAAKLVYGPKPIYPSLARTARVQGVVRLRAVIGEDGTIRNLEVLSGHPLLVRAALHVVSHWRYRPTLLDGKPVEVETEIDVKFTLGN
jgi:periplasmic protein TonB